MRKSFTLLELLIVSSIFSIILINLYLTFSTGIISYCNIEKEVLFSRSIQKFFLYLASDLMNCFSYSSKDTKFYGDKTIVSFLTVKGDIIQWVKYELEGDKLLRKSRKGKDSLREEVPFSSKFLAQKVESLSFFYGYKEKNKILWKEKWNRKDRLPLGVKIRLKLKEDNEVFEKICFLPTS